MNIEEIKERSHPSSEETPVPEPGTGQPQNRRTHFPKVDFPKNKQFTGRATEAEFERIKEAMELHATPGKTYDIVRFVLDTMDHIEADFMQTFKTKKKK